MASDRLLLFCNHCGKSTNIGDYYPATTFIQNEGDMAWFLVDHMRSCTPEWTIESPSPFDLGPRVMFRFENGNHYHNPVRNHDSILTIRFESPSPEVTADVLTVIETVLPYMLDNVVVTSNAVKKEEPDA